jgi:hypothetical protein
MSPLDPTCSEPLPPPVVAAVVAVVVVVVVVVVVKTIHCSSTALLVLSISKIITSLLSIIPFNNVPYFR